MAAPKGIDYSQYEVREDGSTPRQTTPNKVTADPTASLQGLPRHGAVEAAIQGRQDMMSRGMQNIGRTVSDEQINPFKRTMSPIVGTAQMLGGGFQRGEAAIANPVLEFQKFKQQEINPFGAMVEGLKGERLGEIGDPYRKLIKNPVVSEAVGIGMGLFSMNAFTAAKVTKLIGKAGKRKNISAYDDLADTNLQALGNSVKAIGKNVKDKWEAAVEPYKNNDTVHRVTDVAAKISNKFADVFDGTLGRLNKIAGGTDTGLVTPQGQKIVRRLTIDEMTDLVGDMYTDVNKYIMKTIEATKKKPNTTKLYTMIDDVKVMLRKSFPEDVQKFIGSMLDEYGNIVPKVDDLMFELGWSPGTKTFDTNVAAKLFTKATEATKRGFIKKLSGIDKNITKYNNALIKWGEKVSPKRLGVGAIGAAAGFGSALGQKAFNKAKNLIVSDGGNDQPSTSAYYN